MPACAQCHRPIALSRPHCLYCGAPIDPARLPAIVTPSAAPAAALAREPLRSVVVLDFEAADAGVVAAALDLTAFEAAQRVRRGGWQIHKITDAESAERESARVTGVGVSALVLSEAEVALAENPTITTGGRQTDRGLTLRTEAGTVEMPVSELLLVVTGRIERATSDPSTGKGSLSRRLDPGLRIHFHFRHEPRPIELDPDTFAFDDVPSVPSSTLLVVKSWVAVLCPPVTLDEGFKDVTPALAPTPASEPPMYEALRAGKPRKGGVTVLDNLLQFRFHSGWRSAVARRVALR
jgi:hypothetical protein